MTIGTKVLSNVEVHVADYETMLDDGKSGITADIKKYAPNVEVHGFWVDKPYVYVNCTGTELDLCKMVDGMGYDINSLDNLIDEEILEQIEAEHFSS
jgi:hypothetical protein